MREEHIIEAKGKYNAYSTEEWIKAGFDEYSGGYIVIHKGHKFDIKNGEYELKTATILANNGYVVELMDEPGRVPQYDAKVNNIPTEIKIMNGFRNIHKRAEAASHQGASRIVYYICFDDNKEMFKRFSNVYKTIEKINEIWYIKNERLSFFDKIESPL
jgi:hypothetical protein